MQRNQRSEQLARIRAVGVGGGGSTAVNHLCDSGIFGVDFVAVDTDVYALKQSRAALQIRVGDDPDLAGGSRGQADRSRRAAESSASVLSNALYGSDLVFVIAGLGGGTGTGVSPVISRLAKEQGALVIAIVTYPFKFEGDQRLRASQDGIEALRKWTDTLIVMPNDRFLAAANGAIGFHETYRLANDVWRQSVRVINDLVGNSGLINVDFADLKAILSEGGGAIIASGQARGKDRARIAALQATRSDLLGLTVDGAQGVLFNVCGGPNLSLLEVEQAAEIITSKTHPQANVIFGAVISPTYGDEISITVIATGFRFSGKDPDQDGPVIRRVRPGAPGQPWKLESVTCFPTDFLSGTLE